MKRDTKRSQQAAETKRRIFEMSLELFAKKGFENVHVEEICSELGLSKGTFYVHFRSKSQIPLEVFLDMDNFMENTVSKKLAQCSGIRQKMDAWLDASLKYYEELGKTPIRISYQSQLGQDKKTQVLSNRKRPIFGMFESIIKEGQESGEIRTDMSARDLAIVYVHSLRGVFYDWCQTSSKDNLEQELRKLSAVLWRGLLPV
jgi:AcrR family transcriptional regulator